MSHPGAGAAGYLLIAMVLSSIGWALWPASAGLTPPAIIGVIAFLAAGLLLPCVHTGQRLQALVLLVVGLVLAGYAASQGVVVDVARALTRNTSLLTLILSVGFLKLVVAGSLDAVDTLPVGRKPFFQTLLGTALFGAVINISAMLLIADRLTRNRPMDLFTAAALTRTFSACAAWSPFFAGMGVVLTHVGQVRLPVVMASGSPLALVSLAVVYGLARWRQHQRVDQFRGYPLQAASLWVPALLALMVLVAHDAWPALPVVIVIATSALLLTTVYLMIRTGPVAAWRQLHDFVRTELAKSSNEMVLFLVAGVLASGLDGLVALGILTSPFEAFNANTASLLLGVMILISAAGIHPVIQISALTPLLLGIDPSPELLALTFLFAWSLGTCASPLSATHMVLQGRYDIPAWRSAMQNWPYVAGMYGVAAMLLQVHAALAMR